MVNYYIFSFVCSFIPCVLLRHLTHHVRQVFVSRISYLKSTCILLKSMEKTYFNIKGGGRLCHPSEVWRISFDYFTPKIQLMIPAGLAYIVCCQYFLLRNLIILSNIVLDYAQ